MPSHSIPAEYARICDAFGTGYFIVPGTETCLTVRGSRPVLPHGTAHAAALDRAESLGDEIVSPGGGGGAEAGASWATSFAGDAFIRFAGLAAGYGRHVLEFPAGGGKPPGVRGAGSASAVLAYTATFGSEFPVSIVLGDETSRPAAGLGTIAALPGADPISINGISSPAFPAGPGGWRVPDILAAKRQDPPLGTVRLSEAEREVRPGLLTDGAEPVPSAPYPVGPATSGSFGVAVPKELKLDMDYLSPRDKLWLQAAYGDLARSSIASDGSGHSPEKGTVTSRTTPTSGPPSAEPSGASQHARLPTFSVTPFGTAKEFRLSPDALAGFGGGAGVGDAKLGPNVAWSPARGFDIGAEFLFIDAKPTRRAGPPAEAGASAAPKPGEYQGRLRVQPGF